MLIIAKYARALCLAATPPPPPVSVFALLQTCIVKLLCSKHDSLYRILR